MRFTDLDLPAPLRDALTTRGYLEATPVQSDGPSSWPPPASSRFRSSASCSGSSPAPGCAPWRAWAACPSARRLARWRAARTWWWAPRGGSATTSSAARCTSRRSRRWCSTRPTRCSTWASATSSTVLDKRCPAARRTLMFSATLPARSCASRAQWMRDPARVSATPPHQAHARHRVPDRPRHRRARARARRGQRAAPHEAPAAIVFCATREGTNRLAASPARAGLPLRGPERRAHAARAHPRAPGPARRQREGPRGHGRGRPRPRPPRRRRW
jgi:hypothetical protein